jgi:hypothetical protein
MEFLKTSYNKKLQGSNIEKAEYPSVVYFPTSKPLVVVKASTPKQ